MGLVGEKKKSGKLKRPFNALNSSNEFHQWANVMDLVTQFGKTNTSPTAN